MGGASIRAFKQLREKVLTGTLTAGSAAYVWYYLQHICKVPRLYHHQDSKLPDFIRNHCKSLLKPYRPTPWLIQSNAQTIIGLLRAFTIHAGYDRQLITCPDGGTVALDWWRACNKNESLAPGTPVVLVLHGVGGNSEEGYCKWMCEAAASSGWRPAVLNYRGCGGLRLTSPKTYCASFIDDVQVAIDIIHGMYPDAPLGAVGYSLGSKILTKYVATFDHRQEGSKLKCAVMISNPFCFVTTTRKVECTLLPPALSQVFWSRDDELSHRAGQASASQSLLLRIQSYRTC